MPWGTGRRFSCKCGRPPRLLRWASQAILSYLQAVGGRPALKTLERVLKQRVIRLHEDSRFLTLV